jgi:hypothetical protein
MTSYADTAAGTTDTRNKYKILQGCNWQGKDLYLLDFHRSHLSGFWKM